MRNPLKKLFKNRGYPDSSHVNNGNSSSCSTIIPSSAPLPPSSASSALCVPPSALPPPPAGWPSANSHVAGYNNQYNPYNNMVQPPTAHPYNPPQQDSVQVWEIDAGNNANLKGNQKAGNVRAANSAAGCAPAINLPQNGRFVINSGGNTNHGDLQESGNVDFANIG